MNLENKTLVQLKDIARSNGLKNWSKLTKKPLIEFLMRNGIGEDEPSRARSKSPRPSTSRARSKSPRPSTSRARSKSPRPSTSRARSKSPLRSENKIPVVVVKAMLNLDRTMDKIEFLKRVQKTQLVRYANELGIKGKSLSKGPLLEKILETSLKDARDEYVSNIPKFLTDIPISIDLRDRVYEILDEIEKYDDEFSTVLKEEVLSVAEQLRDNMARYQKKYSNLSSEIIKSRVFEHVLKDNIKSRLQESLNNSSLTKESYDFLVAKLAHDDDRVLKDILKELNANAVAQVIEETVSEKIEEAEAQRIRELVDVVFTRYFVHKTIVNYTMDIAAELARLDENLEEILYQKIVDRFDTFDARLVKYRKKYPDAGQQELVKIVSNDLVNKSIESTIAHALKDGMITEADAADLLRRIVPIEENTAKQVTRQIAKQVRKARPETVQDIENLLREVQKPGKTVAGIATIQKRVFKCLGLEN
jgi:bacterioferritin (cytochrome b1)